MHQHTVSGRHCSQDGRRGVIPSPEAVKIDAQRRRAGLFVRAVPPLSSVSFFGSCGIAVAGSSEIDTAGTAAGDLKPARTEDQIRAWEKRKDSAAMTPICTATR